MSKAWHAAKLETAEPANREIGRESVEVSEAIKALQSQLADLRKIVQAAKAPDDDSSGSRRRQ